MQTRFVRTTTIYLLMAGLTGSCALPSWGVTATIDPNGYHPKAPKTIHLKDLPGDQPVQVRVVDPKVLDPIFLKPKTVYKATVEGRTPQGDWLLPLTDLQTTGSYQLQIGKTLLPDVLTVSPSRYWLQAQKDLPQLLSLQSLPNKCGELACDSEPNYLAHSGQGWRSDPKVRTKLTADNALAMTMLMQWHQVNPKVQATLPVGQSANGILAVLEPQLRWLMDMHQTKGLYAGMQWAPDKRCYTLLPGKPQSTLLGIAALAKASKVYRHAELGFAVKCLMMAEDLWQQLPKTLPAESAQLMGLASAELWLATQKPLYESAFWQSIQRLPPTAFSNDTPLALGVVDMLKWGDSLSPDQKSWLSTWLTTPLPDLTTLDGLTQRVLVTLTQDDTTALHQVASHLPTATPATTLPNLSKWVWLNGMLNELYNQLPATPEGTRQAAETQDGGSPMTPQAVLARWAAKRSKHAPVQSNLPAVP